MTMADVLSTARDAHADAYDARDAE